MSDYIALLDPSLMNNDGMESTNLGDLIIFESIEQQLKALFPAREIIRVSSHVPLEDKHRKIFKHARLSFLGGTNLLTSHIVRFMQMPIRKSNWVWLFPGIKNLIVFGAGWGYGYGTPTSARTRVFYNQFLHRGFVHALRDRYSADKLSREAGLRTRNTCCPSMWNLKVDQTNRTRFITTALFTLTDYETQPAADQELLSVLFTHFDRLTFFPQGALDTEYLQSLPLYQKNKTKVSLLPHSYSVFQDYLASTEITYVGTRLHGGIKCLQHHYESMIISFDNRSLEIGRDTHLPICPRSDYSLLSDWLEGKRVFERPLTLPQKDISSWKDQFTGL